MGKSTCAELLRERDVAVIDTDLLARELVEPGQPAFAEIVAAFGVDLIDPVGNLRRDVLAKRVFSDSQARQTLETILHPRIRAAWKSQLEQWSASGKQRAAVVIPLLFETKAESEFISIICVACTAQTQRQRLADRGWSIEQASQRIASQLPIEEKMARSRFVIWTEGGMDVHAAQLDRVLAR
jgi:dephospho-CoA kinase